MEDGKLIIDLVQPDDNFDWQVLRIQAHRPEDDIIHTEFKKVFSSREYFLFYF